MGTDITTQVITFRSLTKRYGPIVALDAIDLDVGRGEIVGLLGPNGAGKSTAMKLLVGLARPTSGTGLVLGAPLGDRATRRRIGYLPELFRYQPWMGAREILLLHGELAGLSRTQRLDAAEDVLTRVGLVDRANDLVGRFSKGMQQRLGLGVALLGAPDLVLLDEPTSALDPVGRTEVRDILRSARDRGATIILNSHLLTEAERVCDRVVILDHGRIVAAGGLDDVLAGVGVRLRVTDLAPAQVAGLGKFGAIEIDGTWLTIRRLDPDRVPELVAAIVAGGGRVHAVEPSHRSLEDAFMELVASPPTRTEHVG